MLTFVDEMPSALWAGRGLVSLLQLLLSVSIRVNLKVPNERMNRRGALVIQRDSVCGTEMTDDPKTRGSFFETVFLRYGAGSHVFHPLTRNKFWNAICWTLIVLGVIGWILALWFIRANFGSSGDTPLS
jgi:hypothetical protein